MIKKLVLIFMLTTMLAGGAFAIDGWEDAKNSISVDLGLLHAGLRFERMFTSNLSVGAVAYVNSFFFFWNELDLGIFTRYYIFDGFFGELGVGYHIHTGDMDYERYDGSTYTWFGDRTGIAISPGIGYKIDFGKPGGFFFTPAVTVPITMGDRNKPNGVKDPGFGVSYGVVVYFSLGFSM